jgi:small subunit ribosomal protein S6
MSPVFYPDWGKRANGTNLSHPFAKSITSCYTKAVAHGTGDSSFSLPAGVNALSPGVNPREGDWTIFMRHYELVVIIYPDAEEEELTAIVDKISQVITTNGGQVLETEVRGRRRLAYPIRKFREGYYVVMQVQLEKKGIGELERSLKLTEEVIRHLLVRVGK